jgi:hypothetical protein
MHLAPQEWPCVLPAIQAVLNNSPSSHRAGQTPLTAFTGYARDSSLSLTILHPMKNQYLSFIKAQQLAESTNLTQQFEQLHKEVTDKVSRQRRKQMEAQNANTHLVQPNFFPGDYVLRAEPQRVQQKLTLIWKGPYQVDKCFDNPTLRVNSLVNGPSLSHTSPGRACIRTRCYRRPKTYRPPLTIQLNSSLMHLALYPKRGPLANFAYCLSGGGLMKPRTPKSLFTKSGSTPPVYSGPPTTTGGKRGLVGHSRPRECGDEVTICR